MGWLGKLFGSGDKTKETMTMEPHAVKEGKEVMETVVDPVCGMNIDPKTAPAKSEYMGRTYYFCALGCKKTFDANPAKYVKGGQETAGHSGHKM